MTDTTISVRINKATRERMREMEEINWSAVLRRALIYRLNKREDLEKREDEFDYKKAREAADDMDRLRKSGAFSKGKSGVDIIREWRNKRK